MEENKDYEEEGISLKDIFHWIWRGKIPGLITGGVALLILFIVFCIINPTKELYEVEFDYASVPGLLDGKYIDGTKFNYKDIIIEENVNEILTNNKIAYNAKQTEFDYSTINLDILFGDNKFAIDERRIYWEMPSTREDGAYEAEIKSRHYVITMPPKAFKSEDQARAFARDLAGLPLVKTKEMIKNVDFNTNIDLYSKAQSFDAKLLYLQNQVKLIQDGYKAFTAEIAGAQYVINGVTYNLSTISAQIDDFLESKNFSTMEAEIRLVGYVSDKALARSKYTIELENLKDEEKYLQKQLDSVNKTYNEAKDALANSESNSALTSDQVLALLTQLNDTLLKQKTEAETKLLENQEEQRKLNIKLSALDTLSDEENALFAARLDSIHTELTKQTVTYDLIYKDVTARNTNVYYSSSNVIATVGGMGAIMLYGVPVAVGILGFVAVAWIYGYIKCKKEENNIIEPKVQQ